MEKIFEFRDGKLLEVPPNGKYREIPQNVGSETGEYFANLSLMIENFQKKSEYRSYNDIRSKQKIIESQELTGHLSEWGVKEYQKLEYQKKQFYLKNSDFVKVAEKLCRQFEKNPTLIWENHQLYQEVLLISQQQIDAKNEKQEKFALNDLKHEMPGQSQPFGRGSQLEQNSASDDPYENIVNRFSTNAKKKLSKVVHQFIKRESLSDQEAIKCLSYTDNAIVARKIMSVLSKANTFQTLCSSESISRCKRLATMLIEKDARNVGWDKVSQTIKQEGEPVEFSKVYNDFCNHPLTNEELVLIARLLVGKGGKQYISTDLFKIWTRVPLENRKVKKRKGENNQHMC